MKALAALSLLLCGCTMTPTCAIVPWEELPGSPPRLIHQEGNVCTYLDGTEGEQIIVNVNCTTQEILP